MKKIAFLFIFMVFLLSGCGKETAQEYSKVPEGAYTVYYYNTDKTSLVPYGYSLKASKVDDQINELLGVLKESVGGKKYISVLPSDVTVVDWTLTDENTLLCYFSPSYLLAGVSEEVMMRAAIVETLTQIRGVNKLEFYIEDQPLVVDGSVVGPMKAEQFLNDVGMSINKATWLLYYSNEDKTALVPVPVEVEMTDFYTPEQMVLETLLEGPKQPGCISAIPEGTKVNHIVTRDGICYVDFNEAFLDYLPEMPAKLTIYSIVNSLAELNTVSKVVFTVNDSTKDFYINMDLTRVFDRLLEIVEE